jgi:hypothetical protein
MSRGRKSIDEKSIDEKVRFGSFGKRSPRGAREKETRLRISNGCAIK